AGVVELVDEIVAGGPEQLALHGVAADVDGAVAVDVRLPDLLDADQVRHPAGEQHHGGQYAEHHADGEVAGEHGGDDGDQHDRGLGPGHHPQRGGADAVPVEGAHGDHHHHRDQSGHRDQPHDVAEGHDQDQQEQPGQEGGQPGAGPGLLHVDHRLADHGAAAHAAEEAGDHVRDALAPRLAGLVRVGVGDVVDQL